MKCIGVVREAVVVGLILAVAGMTLLNKLDFISLFILGVSFHISCELFGINKWYCRHGVACSK